MEIVIRLDRESAEQLIETALSEGRPPSEIARRDVAEHLKTKKPPEGGCESVDEI